MAQTVNVAAPAASERYAGITLLERLRQIGILVALLVIGLVFSFLTPTFLTMSNLQNIAVQSSITAILGIGMTLIIISGGIDLSIGPIVALVTVVVATILLQGTPIWLAIAIGLGIGVLCAIPCVYIFLQLKELASCLICAKSIVHHASVSGLI